MENADPPPPARMTNDEFLLRVQRDVTGIMVEAFKALSVIDSDRITRLEMRLLTLMDAVTEVSANVKQMRDQMSLLEDAREMYVGLRGDNSPPPIAKPAQPAKPHRQGRAA